MPLWMVSRATSRWPSASSDSSLGRVKVKLLYPVVPRRSCQGWQAPSKREASSSGFSIPAKVPNPTSGTRPPSRSVFQPPPSRAM
jgi:hypothetical protein